MRRGSVVGPLILIAIGALFLVNNLNPELSVVGVLSRFWPFVLIAWGLLRLIEILFWTARRKPLPAAGISGGEWTLVILISILGSGLYFVNQRTNWPPFHIRMKGIEVFGEAFDYPLPDKSVEAGMAPRVVVENARGNARITGTDGAEVAVSGRKTVRALSRGEAERAALAVEYEVTREGDTVFVRAGQKIARDNEFVTTDLEIRVPKGARVECKGRRGDFDVTNVAGDVEVESDNAGVRLESIGGKVRVETRASDIVRASGVKGGVELKGYGHDVELENIDGPVVVAGNYFGELQFRNISKPVRFEGGIRSRTTDVRVEACPGQIRIARGDLTLERVIGPVMVYAKSKDVQIADFTQELEVKLERGDVEVRPSRAPIPKMHIVTESGNIELSLPDKARFSLKATARKGDIENDYGDVLRRVEEGRGAALAGSVGDGPPVILLSEHGRIRVRRAATAEFARPLTPHPPAPPEPLPAERPPLAIERN